MVPRNLSFLLIFHLSSILHHWVSLSLLFYNIIIVFERNNSQKIYSTMHNKPICNIIVYTFRTLQFSSFFLSLEWNSDILVNYNQNNKGVFGSMVVHLIIITHIFSRQIRPRLVDIFHLF